jgi:hypothetical protein
VKLKFDKYSEIAISSCDCPAGAGSSAVCKHVAAALFTLGKIRTNRELGHVNKGCTDRLQSFHKPSKGYEGKLRYELVIVLMCV